MKDSVTSTELDAARHLAQHADRSSDYDRADETLGREPRAASPEFADRCARLVRAAGGGS